MFVGLLVLSTVVPFFMGCLTILHWISVTWIISFLAFLALVHVPMTVYLMSDAGIRDQMRSRRLLMMGGCLFWIALSMFAFTAFSAALGSKHTAILYFFALASIMWQSWHFGKQNLGVFALSRIATRTGPVAKFERYTIVAGAVCGIVASYLMVGRALQHSYSPTSDFSAFWAPMDVISAQFRWFQYALGAAAVVYVVYNFRRKFTLGTATLYMFGVLFFFPQFFAIDFPQSMVVFGIFTYAHGLQYMLILFYHSVGSVDMNRRAAEIERHADVGRLARGLKVIAPILFFALCMVGVFNFYTSYGWINFGAVVSGVTNSVMRLQLSSPMIGGLAAGLSWGILLSHFWLDSFFWRLKEQAPREWVRSRYAFLFGK